MKNGFSILKEFFNCYENKYFISKLTKNIKFKKILLKKMKNIAQHLVSSCKVSNLSKKKVIDNVQIKLKI